MNIRSENIRRKSASAAAALVVSAFFISAAVGPAISTSTIQTASTQSVVRAA
ncbi:hypothetical protein [Sphingosinicella sp. YJ22]|uniref:hypothetical protein n=1 Tax=Sphingosinicella sp. YJ22 TaxID=1104780 RepID=UPI00140DDCCA|nr:hypothetical protein [Sphingosinicella sp. YJ22]